ncbi:PAS domain-containing protein [Falsochrobactrum sp. TDYN1]|uniref:PAS domain-containing protein n=1 Tax=Falsochrobactrum tianjinense TaxID=2706015 RepID=A0A949PM42_9HYPH|nr:PAS domain-containing protein [Falsochrobactrum sp. TDYN1]MBV2143811.1 PAS domain-containing protein [Falsochrobactrum sp. TDYN1]
MKHRSTIAIFSEWQRLAFSWDGSLHAPSRESIAPRKLGRHLSDLFFLEEDESGELIFRLAGTRVCALFGRELKATRFLSLWPGRNHSALDELILEINDLLVPAISYHDGISLAGRSLAFEMLLAPLESHKGQKTNLLGAISLLDDVTWAGADPLVLASLNAIEPLAPDLAFTQETSRPSVMTVNAPIRTPSRSRIHPRPQTPLLRVIAGGKA